MVTKGIKNFVFVLGGARSGKSSFAMKLVGSCGCEGTRAYIATAEALDSEMAERIEEHRKTRGTEWITIEEPLQVEKRITGGRGFSVILIDCLTLWLTNLVGMQGLWGIRHSSIQRSRARAGPRKPHGQEVQGLSGQSKPAIRR
jgi:adenosyl cobinamide kinase/adenosyl cobinamide phosphate guanylyltransferase